MKKIIQPFDSKQKKSILSFVLSLVGALLLTWIIREPGFTDSQVYVIFLLFFSIGLWFTEAIPAFAVSLLIMAFLTFALGNKYFNSQPENIAKYVNTFSSSVIWLLLGGFFLASAMTKTKLDEALFRLTLKISGTNPRRLLIGLMLTTMIASTLMSNTATTAMVIAAIMPLMANLKGKSGVGKALLLGIPVASSIGGMATIIGTPPNAIAAGALNANGLPMEFVNWMIFGLPIAMILTLISCFTLIRIFIRDHVPVPVDFLDKSAETATTDSIRNRRIVVSVIIVTIGLWLTTSLHGFTVASVCAVPLVILTLTGILDRKDIQGLPWDVLLLVAGGLSLGVAMEETGLLNLYAGRLISINLNSTLMFFIFAYLTMIVSNIMSNTAASTVMIPLGMAILPGMKTEVAVIIALAASTSILLPVSTPSNAIAYSTGYLEQKDFRVVGIVIGLTGPLLATLWVLLSSHL